MYAAEISVGCKIDFIAIHVYKRLHNSICRRKRQLKLIQSKYSKIVY